MSRFALLGAFVGVRTFLVAVLGASLAACGGGGGDDDPPAPPPPATTFTVSGNVTGLTAGNSIVLRLNGANDVTVNAPGGAFSFAAALANGASYGVGIVSQPGTQVCGPTAAGNGTISGANVTNVTIECASYTIGGKVAGLTASGLVLTVNTGNDLAVAAASTTFQFPSTVSLGGSVGYLVHIKSQPVGQTCTIVKALGIVGPAGPNPRAPEVACVANVTDALSGTFRLASVDGEPADVRAFLTFNPEGTFIFGMHDDTPGCGPAGHGGVEYGVYDYDATTHAFTVPALPLDLSDCGLDPGLTGTLVVGANGSLVLTESFTAIFTPVPSTTGSLIGSWGDSQGFAVYGGDNSFFVAETRAVQQFPANTLSIEDGCYTLASGTMASGSFTTNLTNTCALGGGQSGHDGTGANFGLSQFGTVARTFAITGDSGTFQFAPNFPLQLTTARILFSGNETPSTFSVGGTISGLTGTGLNLRLNGQTAADFNVQPPAGAAAFTFPAHLTAASPYAVIVTAQPASPTQLCFPQSNAIGTISAGDIGNVVVACNNSFSYTVGGTVSGLTGDVTVRVTYFSDSLGALTTADVTVSTGATTYAFPASTIPANRGYVVGILDQPAGQTCTLIRGTGFSIGTTAVGNVDVTCVANPITTPLAGTYSALIGDGRGYLNFNADGTMTTVLIHNDDCSVGIPALDARQGNGVEYGVFSWNSATGAFKLHGAPAVDTNGDCGLWEPGQTPPDPRAYIARVGNTIEYRDAPSDPAPLFAAPAVASTPGTLVGGWVPEANGGGLLVFHADGTFVWAETQVAGLYPYGYGQERGCYTVAGSELSLSIEATCLPDGLAAYDLNAGGGAFPNGIKAVGPIPFTLAGDSLTVFARTFKRTAPN